MQADGRAINDFLGGGGGGAGREGMRVVPYQPPGAGGAAVLDALTERRRDAAIQLATGTELVHGYLAQHPLVHMLLVVGLVVLLLGVLRRAFSFA
jgi:hypothetical protein